MALTQISTGGVKDDAVTAGKIPAGAVGSSEIAKPIDLADNEKIRLGTVNDLQIYHDGSHNYLDVISGGNGNLYMSANGSKSIYIRSGNGSSGVNQAVTCLNSGAVELYYDGVKTFSTTSNGINILGPEGGAAQLDFNADEGDDNADKWKMYIPDGGGFHLQNKASGNWENSLIANSDAGGVQLYYDSVKKFETTSAGVTVTGTVTDSIGNVRHVIRSVKSSAHTLVAADSGTCILISSGGVTVNANVFGTAGHAVTIINDSGSDQTITQGSGISIYNTADASTGNRTLAGRGMATIWFASGTTAYISGAGLS